MEKMKRTLKEFIARLTDPESLLQAFLTVLVVITVAVAVLGVFIIVCWWILKALFFIFVGLAAIFGFTLFGVFSAAFIFALLILVYFIGRQAPWIARFLDTLTVGRHVLDKRSKKPSKKIPIE